MAQLSWGKPTIEFGKCVNGATPSVLCGDVRTNKC